MKNKDISKVDGDGIDDSSMQDIENSINNGNIGVESQKKKKGGSALGAILIAAAIGLFAASGFLSPGMDIQTIAPDTAIAENEGKLVHITGIVTEGEFTDPMFKVSSKGVLLERIVEMYQWVEENGLYSKKWESKLIDISSEEAKSKGIINPAEMPFVSEKWQAEEVKIGAFSLSPNLSKQIGDPQDIALVQEDFEKLDSEGKQAFKLQNGAYFFGLDVDKPRVGDLKIHFRKLDSATVSIIAQQKGTALVAFTSDNGVVEKLRPGSHNLEEMLAGSNLENTPYITWAARAGAIILALLGIVKILKAPRVAKKPKEPKVKKEKPTNKKAIPEEVTPVVADTYQPEEATREEQQFIEEEFAPVTDNFTDNINDSAIEPENYTISQPEMAPTTLGPVAYSATEIAPPPLEFESASEEMPSGIEIIGPDSLSEEPKYEATELPQEITAQAPIYEQGASLGYDDTEDFPEGIEMIGPDSASNSSYEIPPPPEPDEINALSFEPSEASASENPGLDYMPTFTPPSEEEEDESQLPEYSAYELAEPPPSFSPENEITDDLEDLNETFNPADIPPPPLDFEQQDVAEDTAEAHFDPEYLSSDFELPAEETDEAPIPEDDEENEEEEYDDFDEEDLDDQDESTAFPEVPPLPLPAILMGRKMTFDNNIAEEPSTPALTPTPDDTYNAQAEEHHDVFTDLLNNIPDDFDPNAEMKAPEEPTHSSVDTEEFDPFAEPEDENFSPYVTSKE